MVVQVVFVLCLLAAVVALIILAIKYRSLKHRAELTRQEFEQWRARELDAIRQQSLELARQEFEQWQARELDAIKQQSLELARREMQVEFERWKDAYELSIRRDAIQKSQAVILGKVTEHFIPYMPDFPYNPKDARFIGSPVDFVVFDGLNDGEVRKIVFVEVKTGSSGLSARERRVRDAICSGCVEWKEVRTGFGNDVREWSLSEQN